MSFDWYEYCKLARNLIGQSYHPTKEAKDRAALSRAYYSLYNTAYQYSIQRGAIFANQSKHGQLIEYFKRQNDVVHNSVAELLRRLLAKRVQADYKNSLGPLSDLEIEKAIRDADKGIQQINGLIGQGAAS